MIQFDSYDLSLINIHAARLRAAREAAGSGNKKYSEDLDDWDAHYIGAMGEYAVGKKLGTKLDKKIYSGRDGRDDGIDTNFRGHTIQIKTFTFTGPNMTFFMDIEEKIRAEILIGVQIVKPTRVKIMGWLTSGDFQKKKFEKNYGYGNRHAVLESALLPIENLIKTLVLK